MEEDEEEIGYPLSAKRFTHVMNEEIKRLQHRLVIQGIADMEEYNFHRGKILAMTWALETFLNKNNKS